MTHKGYDPRAIANEIIEYALDEGIHMPNVSVQKLLYFCHASYYVRHNEPLVASVFEAWEYGPVCRPVYDELKHYGRKSIDKLIDDVDIFTGEVRQIRIPRNRRVQTHIYNTLENLGRLSPGQLIDLSHRKGGAWHETWHKSRTGTTVGGAICDKLTLERFYLLKMTVQKPVYGDPDEATPLTGD